MEIGELQMYDIVKHCLFIFFVLNLEKINQLFSTIF